MKQYVTISEYDRCIGKLKAKRRKAMKKIVRKDVRLVNLTPFILNIANSRNQIYEEIPKGRTIARVYLEEIQVDDVNGIPVIRDEMVDSENVPDPIKGVIYIVTRPVFQHIQRSDMITPNVGNAVRSRQGKIVAIKSFLTH